MQPTQKNQANTRVSTPTHTELKTLLEFAVSTARAAGEIMRDYFYRADQNVSVKADKTLVTEADTLINNLVIGRVQQVWPEHGVLGEEASLYNQRKELWVCDPIDGTNGFVVGLPTAVFSLAYVLEGVPLVAVVFNPLTNEMFTAMAGKGAMCNGQAMRVSRRGLQGAVLGGPGGLREIEREIPVYAALRRLGVTVRPFGGMVYQCCLVARGKLDGRLFPGYGAHDIAAVKLIVEEAGGCVTDINGQEQAYDQPIKGAVVSNGLIHQELVTAVRNNGNEDFLGFSNK